MAKSYINIRLWTAILYLFFLLPGNVVIAQENSVSIGTDQLKQSAVLWLKGNGKQGFLLPAVKNTTEIVTSDIEPGMMVFQTSDNKIYWYNGAWLPIGDGSGTGGSDTYNLELVESNLRLLKNGSIQSEIPISVLPNGSNNKQVLVWNAQNNVWGAGLVERLQGFDLPSLNTLQNTSDERVLIFNGGTDKWELRTLSSGGGPVRLEDLLNVSSNTPQDGHVLRYNNSTGEWEPSNENTFSGSFNDLADVPVNLDVDATDDFSGNYNDLINKPTAGNISYTDNHNLNAANVQGAIDALANAGGDMNTSAYDTDGNTIVDNADSLNGQSGSYYLERANHTGTQDVSTVTGIIDNDATNEIQHLAGVLTEGNDAGGAGIKNIADPVLAQDAATKAYVDANAGGDMNTSVYDTDGNTIVDNADSLNGQSGSFYLNRANHTGTQDVSTITGIVDNDATNEIQHLAGVLTEGNDGGGAGIKNIADPVLAQDAATKAYVDANTTADAMSASVYDTDGNNVVDNADSLNGQSGSYYLNRSNHTGIQDVSTITGIVDNDATNEIQDLQFNGTSNLLSITNNAAATEIDLNKFLDNTDAQQLGYDAANRTLNLENGGSVTLANDLQNLAGVLTEGNDGGGAGIKNIADPVLAQDAATKAYVDANNTADAMAASVYDTDGNNVVDNADSLNGQYGSYYLERANHTGMQDVSTITGIVDNDTTNEIQNISFSATTNILSLTEPGKVDQEVDLSIFLDNTDNQTLSAVLTEGNDAGGAGIKNIADPVLAQDAATKAYVDASTADAMSTSVYDTDGNNVVDNADSLNGQYGSYYLNRANHTGTQDVATITGIVDNDTTNEIQNISFSATTNILSLTEPGKVDQEVDLSIFLDNTDNQTLSAVLTEGNDAGGAGIKNIADPVLAQDAATKAYVDANNTADAMSASVYDTDGNTLVDNADSLNGQYGSYYLERANHTGMQDVATITGIVDNDTTNEIQNISFSATTNILSLTEPGKVDQEVDLSVFLDNTDNQTLSAVLTEGNDAGGAGIKNVADPVLAQDAATKAYVDASTADAMSASVYDTDGNNVVDNADSLNGQYGSYYLERANHTGMQDVSTITGIVDNDATNELQSISLSGSTLSLSDDPVNPSGLDLSSINTDNQTAAEVTYDPAVSGLMATDVKAAIDELAAAPDSDNQSLNYDGATQILSLTNGGSVTLNVDDADASTVNEIQNISFSTTTNILSLTEPGQPDQEVDLSILLDNTDNQSLSFSGPAGSATAGEVFNLDISGGTGVTLKEGANISMAWTGTEMTIEAADALSTVATDNTTITGDGRSTNPLLVPSGGIKSEHIANLTIIDGDIADVSPQKLLQSGANKGQVLKWNGTEWAPETIVTDNATITGDGGVTPLSVGVINTVNMATGSVTADKINLDVAGFGLIKESTGELAVDGAVVALDADLGTMAAQDAAAVNITGGTLDNVTITSGTYSGDGSGIINIFDLAGAPVDPTITRAGLNVDDVLKWDGTQWVAAPDATATGDLLGSDRRLKKNIASLTYGLNDILKLKPVSYRYKKGNSDVRLGLIAQEVQPIVPEVVKKMDNEYYGIRYIDLLPVAIKAIQEQQKIIDQQQKEIDELKERLTEAKDAPSNYENLQLQIDGLKAQLEQLSNILNAEAKND